MSEKMQCPGCGGYSSSVLGAVRDGDPCPFCGLSASAIVEINGVRRAKADENLKQRLEDALKRADRAEQASRVAYALFRDLKELTERYQPAVKREEKV